MIPLCSMWFNVHGFFGFQGAEGQSWRRHNPIPQSSVLECVLFTRPGALKHGWTLNSFDVFVFWSTLCWYHNINWGYKLRPCNSRPPPAWTWATQLCPLVGFVNIKRWGYTCNLCPVWWIGWSRTYNTIIIWFWLRPTNPYGMMPNWCLDCIYSVVWIWWMYVVVFICKWAILLYNTKKDPTRD